MKQKVILQVILHKVYGRGSGKYFFPLDKWGRDCNILNKILNKQIKIIKKQFFPTFSPLISHSSLPISLLTINKQKDKNN